MNINRGDIWYIGNGYPAVGSEQRPGRPGGKVAMFLKVQFLEGQKRGEFFRHTPPPKSLYQPFPAGLL